MKFSAVVWSRRIVIASLVVNSPVFFTLAANAQDFSDPATIIMMNAQRRGLVPGPTTSAPDYADPASIIMMNAQRRGLIPAGSTVPQIRPSTSPNSESQSFTGHSKGPFDGAPGNEKNSSPFESAAGAATPATSHAASGMSAQQVFDRGCDKTATGSFVEAIKDYDEAIKIDPNFGKAYANRGSARYNTGDHKGALADFEVAARLMPDNAAVSGLRDQIRNSLR